MQFIQPLLVYRKLLLFLFLFALKYTGHAQEPIFNLPFLIETPNVSFSAEARRANGLQKYMYGKISDSTQPQDVKWLVVDTRQEISVDIEKYSNVRFLELFIYSDTINFAFLKTFSRIEIMELGCAAKKVPVAVSLLKNLSVLKLRTGNTELDAIKDLPKLKMLTIEHSQIESLPAHLNSLDSLKNLFLFDLRDPRQRSYFDAQTTVKDWSSLKDNQTIQKIIVDQCGLKAIPLEFSTCKNLKTLHLKRNFINDFTNFTNLTQIDELSLQSSLMKVHLLPEEILNLKQLKRINLFQRYKNELTLTGISRLTVLEALTCNPRVAKNNGEISAEVFKLKHLQKLILGETNGLSDLTGIAQLTNLEELNVKECSFKTIPVELKYLTKLNKLNFSNNSISNIEMLQELNALKSLRLEQCGIQEFSIQDNRFENLTSLNLSFNPACQIKASVKKLSKLEVLYCSENAISKQNIELLKSKGLRVHIF